MVGLNGRKADISPVVQVAHSLTLGSMTIMLRAVVRQVGVTQSALIFPQIEIMQSMVEVVRYNLRL